MLRALFEQGSLDQWRLTPDGTELDDVVFEVAATVTVNNEMGVPPTQALLRKLQTDDH